MSIFPYVSYEYLELSISGPEIINLFFMLNSTEHEFFMLINLKLLTMPNSFLLNVAEHENFSANKYENANYCGEIFP